MKKRITLKHIASEFNVSIATVSKALNDSHEISTSTKEKIQQYAKDYHYKPNNVALSLLNKKTKTIGVIVPNILNYFFTRAFAGIEEVASKNGFNIISCISNESYEKEVNTMELLKNGTLDGFIISLSEETQVKNNYGHISNAINEGLPVILFDRVTEMVECNKVIVNDLEGAYNATKHMLLTGCKKVALISPISNLSVGKLRIEGYKKALTEFGIKIDPNLIVKIGKKDDFDANIKILLGDKDIDGLLCLEEDSTIKSLEIVKKKRYKIPEEMSIIGFTNGKLPKHVTPNITTVSQHGTYIGKLAAEMLIKQINNQLEQGISTTKVVKTSLIERETTKKLY